MILENQKQIEDVKQYYEILRMRQGQIIEIIKDTSQMLSKIDAQQKFPALNRPAQNQNAEKNIDNGLRLAFSMINALANILDEQMNALNVWERVFADEKAFSADSDESGYGFQDYYEITTN